MRAPSSFLKRMTVPKSRCLWFIKTQVESCVYLRVQLRGSELSIPVSVTTVRSLRSEYFTCALCSTSELLSGVLSHRVKASLPVSLTVSWDQSERGGEGVAAATSLELGDGCGSQCPPEQPQVVCRVSTRDWRQESTALGCQCLLSTCCQESSLSCTGMLVV